MFKKILIIFLFFTIFNCQKGEANENISSSTNKKTTESSEDSEVEKTKLNEEEIKIHNEGVEKMLEEKDDGLFALLKTDKGDILIELYYEKAPLTTINFVGLSEGTLDASSGKHFYDGLSFHRVEPGFVIQGGDPSADGTGGPGYSFYDEFGEGLSHANGVISMANAGPHTNGSQFFITLKELPFLDGKHSVFGKVISNLSFLKYIKKGDKIESVTIFRKGSASNFSATQKDFDEAFANIGEVVKKDEQEKMLKINKKIIATLGQDYQEKNGVLYKILKEGQNGVKPKKGQTVKCHYVLSLLDENVKVDSSIDRGEPFSFEVGEGKVIPGWDITLLDMNIGEKRVIIIPPELGYGPTGIPGAIPGGAFLHFEIELLEIN